jgi:hypothetical protein
MADSAATRLVDFLEDYVLRPGMSAMPEHYDPEARGMLETVEAALRAELASWRACPTGEAVMRRYRERLSSDEGVELERRLRVLNLPTLGSVEADFTGFARTLGLEG